MPKAKKNLNLVNLMKHPQYGTSVSKNNMIVYNNKMFQTGNTNKRFKCNGEKVNCK